MRTTIADLQKMKAAGTRFAMLTVYDHPSIQLAERAGIKIVLVGDTVGMVVHGHETTLPVRLDDVVRHATYVTRGALSALVVGDLPFLTYTTPDEGVSAARRLMQEAGVHAVKLEGGAAVVPVVRRLVEFGVPVMGHLGYTPQSTHQLGVRVQCKDVDTGKRLLADALALEEAGAFAIVLELVPVELAAAVTARLKIPTIGIGAGADCDGQVQVWHDILGLPGGKVFRHAKRYAEIGETITAALEAYVAEVAEGAFPTLANGAKIEPAVLAAVLE